MATLINKKIKSIFTLLAKLSQEEELCTGTC